MPLLTFSKEEREALTVKLREYFSRELSQELGTFDAGFLLTFISEEIGPYFYNLAIRDAQAALHRRVDDIAGEIDNLMKPLTHSRRGQSK